MHLQGLSPQAPDDRETAQAASTAQAGSLITAGDLYAPSAAGNRPASNRTDESGPAGAAAGTGSPQYATAHYGWPHRASARSRSHWWGQPQTRSRSPKEQRNRRCWMGYRGLRSASE